MEASWLAIWGVISRVKYKKLKQELKNAEQNDNGNNK